MAKLTIASSGGAAVAKKGLGEMPLTLWTIVAAIVVYFYIRRASLGIDRHPSEKGVEKPEKGPVDQGRQIVAPAPRRGLLPVLPPVPEGMGAWLGGGGWEAWVGKRFGGE